MQRLTVDAARWTQDESGIWLCLRTKQARQFCEVYDQSKPHDIDIKTHRERRSPSANAYMWTLLDQLAEKLETDKVDLYRSYVKQYGLSKDFTLTESESGTFAVVWARQGLGWFTECVDYAQEKRIIRAYYGSSVYNTKQMSRLLDQIINDCNEQGIITMTEKEKALILDRWDAERDEV